MGTWEALMNTLLMSFWLAIFSGICHAQGQLDVSVDLKEIRQQARVHLKQEVRAKLEESFTLKDDRLSREIVVRISERMPEGVTTRSQAKSPLFYDMKIFDTTGGKRRLVSSPQIVAYRGQEATLEGRDGESEMTLKIASK